MNGQWEPRDAVCAIAVAVLMAIVLFGYLRGGDD